MQITIVTVTKCSALAIMVVMAKTTFLLLRTGLLLTALVVSASSAADSKRIEVYPLSQHYWDSQAGQTLGEIALSLLPHNPRMQQNLMRDIVKLNPDAFINDDPDHLLANKRLWLPNHLTQADSKVNPSHHSVESFSWGNIKRPKR